MAFDFFGSHFFCAFDDQFRFVRIVWFSEKPGFQNQFIIDTVS